jgi:hypothetical protein
MSQNMDIFQDTEKDSSEAEGDCWSIRNEPFYFETDALALRDNPDYSCLLKTLVLLEAQRVKACEDLENLISTKEKALSDPAQFLKYLAGDLRTNEFDMPPRQNVYLTPDIDWSKYYSYVDFSSEELISNQSLTQKFHSLRRKRIVEQIETGASNTSKRIKQSEDKVVNYNKSWDVDEQRRLEELLIEFPPEDNEAARWRKIATKLGSRTPLQVQSHCQKFFIKLAKAGLPVPGRMPNMKTYVTKKGTRGGTRKGHIMNHGIRGPSNAKRIIGRGTTLNEISSMLSSFNPPITMNDDHEDMDDYDDDEDNEGNSGEYYDGNFEDGNDADSSSNHTGNNRNFDDADEDCYNNEYDGLEADSNGFINTSSQRLNLKLEPLSLSDNEFNENKTDNSYFKNALR